MRSFAPTGATVSLGADTASDSVAFSGTGLPDGEFQCRVFNSGTDAVWVAFGPSGATYTAASGSEAVPVPGGAVEVLTAQNPAKARATHAYAITASGTATVYFTPGHGI